MEVRTLKTSLTVFRQPLQAASEQRTASSVIDRIDAALNKHCSRTLLFLMDTLIHLVQELISRDVAALN